MIKRIRSKARRLSTAAMVCGAMEVTANSVSIAAPAPGPLPITCAAGACIQSNATINTWVTGSGRATYTTVGNDMTINQATDKVILNWSSFNIDADHSVTFKQPDANSIALNRIFDGNASQIFGSLQANGQVYLINHNGFLFGATARINTGGLLASTLDISDPVFNDGLLSNTQNNQAALAAADGFKNILVEPGAQITTNAAGQRILLAAKNIDNQGKITANDGQVILAAGQKLYVAASDDPDLRGLLVEVDGGGDVSDRGIDRGVVINSGTVTAERGNITAVGLAVNQNGRMTATTSVSANGSIRLLARDNVSFPRPNGKDVVLTAQSGGAVTLGASSVTEVNPDIKDTSTAFKEQQQSPSTIEIVGKTVRLMGGSDIHAAGGNLSVLAASNPSDAISRANGTLDSEARIRVDAGATIDLSGSVATTSVTRNLVSVELRANELADSPQQRDALLRGKTVVIDARVGTPLADVSGAVASIREDVLERTSQGGAAVFDSAGDIVVAQGATMNVSGGAVNYSGGSMNTTQLIRADGSTVDIGKASKTDVYLGLINPVYKYVSDRWGVVKYIAAPGLGKYEAGYVDGQSAGSIQFLANNMVLNGDFIGRASNGVNQRGGQAQGGQFIVGASAASLSFRAPEISLINKAVPIVIGSGNSVPSGTPLYLTTDFITKGGFSRVDLASDKNIAIAADTPITMTAGGSFAMTAPRIDISGSLTAASGKISARAINPTVAPNIGLQTGLFIADGVSLNVSGRWVNDALMPLGQQPTELLFTKGGNITLQQSDELGSLVIGNNVSLLANGGGWLKQSGSVAGGAGGSIAVGSQALTIGNGFKVAGFGVQGANGGSFSLRAPRIQVVDNTTWLIAQHVDGNATNGGMLQLGTGLFSDFGFAKFSLLADARPISNAVSATILSVQSGAHIDLAAKTLWVDNTANAQASDTTVTRFSTAASLPAYQAKPSSLTLRALSEVDDNTLYGGLSVESGAQIQGNAGSDVTLTTTGNLSFAGSLAVTGGAVNMAIAPGATQLKTYVNRQLTIDDAARIDVAGGVLYTPNDLSLRQGTLLNGGRVTLSAKDGSVNVKSGSIIDVSGTQAELDIQVPGGKAFATRSISTLAGSLSVEAPESIALQGELRAQGGLSNGARNTGGTLSVAMIARPAAAGTVNFPATPRGKVVELVNDASTTLSNGVASIDTDLVTASGVESLTLSSLDRIDIGMGVDLRLGRSVTLDAPKLGIIGNGAAKLAADYMMLGPAQSTVVNPAASSGTGQLELQADHIDLRGAVALNNLKQTTLSSSGDIAMQLNGSLATLGDLTLRAQRVLPATGASYVIDAKGSNSTVRIEQASASPGTPLSVAGSLTIKAPHIVQGGTLLAPFGKIELNASQSLQLLNGSTTSVSGNGALLPYGRVDNGTDWVWGRDASTSSVLDAIPDRTVTLKGATINLAAGATVDVSGGGDLLAYQYTPGTGGKQDVLDPRASGYLKDTYVILPATVGQAAPYDPMMWQGSSLAPGQSIYVAAGSNVPAGVYQLLPARYALVPGAFLVSSLSGYQDLNAGSTAATTDGAAIVAGYYTFGNDQNAAARYSGFVIRPGSYARTLAQYDDQHASSFFAAKALQTQASTTLPRDAGKLVVQVEQAFNTQGTVRGRGVNGGSNAAVEIAASNIEIDSGIVTAGATGAVHLASSSLQNWNIGSLLLGGTRNDAQAINVTSDSIVVHGGATLSADEVVLTANGITMESGATVSSNSASQRNLVLDEAWLAQATALNLTGNNAAKAAVLAVSDLNYLVTQRGVAQSNTGGAILVNSGAQVSSRGAVTVNGAGLISLASNTIDASGASWSLGAGHVAFGNASTATDGLAIDTSLQANLQSARAINLSSARDLDLTRAVTLGSATTKNLTLNADRIVNLAGNAAHRFSAENIAVSGVNKQSANVAAGAGVLTFSGNSIEFGAGELGLSGVAATTFNSSGVVVGAAQGGINAAGDLNVIGTAITGSSGSQTTLKAQQGTLALHSASSTAPAASTLPTGGALNIIGKDIVDDARIIMPSGTVTLEASNSLRLQNGSVIDVAGYKPTLAASGANGGTVNLKSSGTVLMTAGSSISVAAGPQADAGRIDINATGSADLAGSFSGSSDAEGEGGKFSVRAQTLTDFAALNRNLEQGGFNESRSYQVNAGDLNLAAGDAITAQHIELTADTGSVSIDGRMMAASDTQRSSIQVNARGDVRVASTASINASAVDAATQRAGRIELATTAGHINIASTASIQAMGLGQSGSLTLRAPATNTTFNVDSLPTDLSKIDTVILQPLTSQTLTSANAADLDALQAIVSGVASSATAKRSSLGVGNASNVVVRPFADLTSTGDFILSAYDFDSWRFGNQPATVSIRAAGNLYVDGIVSDGFVGDAANFDLDLAGIPGGNNRSTSINLVAGAELSSASMTATRRDIVTDQSSDLTLNDGAVIRSGTGDLSLTAARDIVIGAGAGIYTGGSKGAATINNGEDGDFTLAFPERGGSVALYAGRDAIGSVVVQPVTDWQVRWAPYHLDGSVDKAYWGVDFNRFGWNVGALGGGDVSITAGRNVNDLSAAVADTVANVANDRVEFGGGNLSVVARNDINTGYFYVAKGQGDLNAGGAFGASGNRKIDSRNAGTLLMAGDASYKLSATRDVLFEGIGQATLFESTQFSANNESGISFIRYDADSKLLIQSLGGGITFRQGNELTSQAFNGGFNGAAAYTILPAAVSMNAFGSDFDLKTNATTAPSRMGGISVYARQDILGNGQLLAMSDVSPANVRGGTATNVIADGAFIVVEGLGSSRKDVVHSSDLNPSVFAADRDISNLTLNLAEAVEINAGRDIKDVTLDTQQSGAVDISSIIAGRDIINSGTTGEIRVGGSGVLEVLAGRNINLGFSRGISTTGNLLNGNLPKVSGADILTMAGVDQPLDTRAFLSDIVGKRVELQSQLVDYMKKISGRDDLDFAAASSFYQALPSKQQLSFAIDALFGELVASGRAANADASAGFSRGYDALASLFGNSAGVGNISLPFSRIYTLGGGSISVLAPGGKIDVGLANPPTLTNPAERAFLNNRKPSELGIVAQQNGNVHVMAQDDVLVNTSRIFTLGGGDIAIWSSQGNIDAGKGAKSSISAPPPTLSVDAAGNVTINVGSAVAGSGIRTILTGNGGKPGNVDLIAPAGFVNAGDAGIGSSGNLSIAAQTVVGLDNIQVAGTSSGVPPETAGLGASLSGVTASAGNSTTSAANSLSDTQKEDQKSAPIADAALSWLEVFVVGLGEENCKQDDLECLKRQSNK